MISQNHFDLTIVGGGLVGASLALALANSHFKIALIETQPPRQQTQILQDMRAIALNYQSQQIFKQWDVWPLIAPVATPIQAIHVSEQKRFGSTLLTAADLSLVAFGYVVPIPLLFQAVQAQLLRQPKNLTLFCPAKLLDLQRKPNGWTLSLNEKTISTTLLIAADGERSFVRKKLGIPTIETTHHQSAIVTHIALGKPHNNTAYERFTAQGTFALLPLANQRAAIIWSGPTDTIKARIDDNNDQFLWHIQQAFGYRLGKLSDLGNRQTYPLRELQAEQQIQPNVILLGNAAHTLHPIAAQGFNLSLRDIFALANLLNQTNNLHDQHLLSTYTQQRLADQRQTQRFTQNLVKIFAPTFLPLSIVRSLGLLVFDNLPLAKKRFCQRRMGVCA